NFDWGQGLRSLARIQQKEPRFGDLTLFYFGDTDPWHYGVRGTSYLITAVAAPPSMPASLSAETRSVAVSASLPWGPWGPDHYFERLNAIAPVRETDDRTILIYQTNDLPRLNSRRPSEMSAQESPGRDPDNRSEHAQ